jgi:hypothetical protein
MATAALTVDLNARIAQFETEMKRATGTLDQFGKRSNAVASGLKTAFGALGATLSVGALASFAKSGIEAADALNDMSQRLGVSVKDLASFKLIAEQSGTSLDSVGAGIARLSKSIGEAELGNKNLAGALKQLGITARDPREAFLQLADAVQRIHDPTQRAALLSQVLGKNYGELVPLLVEGGDALRASAAASESFADAMARLAPEADKFNDQLALLKQNAAGAAAAILGPLVSSFNEYIAVMQEVIKTGSLLDKIRFFGLGNASDEIVARVRKAAQAAAQASAAARSAALPSSTIDLSAATRSRSSSKPKLDEIDPFYRERTAAMKAAADQVAETERMIADHLNETNSAIYEQGQAWTEAGRALEDEMRTPLENANIEFGRLQEMLDRGVISWETYTRAVLKTSDALEEAPKQLEKMDTFAKTAAKNIQNSFADFLFDPFQDGVKGMVQSFGQMLQRMIADAVAADLTKKLFGGAGGGSGSGWIGGALSAFGSLLGFADGGVMTGAGAMPLRRYAAGGIASSPQFAMFGEGSTNEAFVPLPDGRAIPVKMKGGGTGNITININGVSNAPDVTRAAGMAARQIQNIVNGSRRYA